MILRFVSQGYRSVKNKVECSLGNLESLHATFEEKYGKGEEFSEINIRPLKSRVQNSVEEFCTQKLSIDPGNFS